MPEFDTEKPRRRVKALGVMLAGFVAVASLALVAVTQEPKKAVSSPVPAKAAIVPQIADAKSELEIHVRGKSYAIYKRPIVVYQGGTVTDIKVNEGDNVEEGKTLAEYDLDPQALAHVYNVVKSASVDNAKKAVADTEIAIKKLKEVAFPIKQIAIDKIKLDLENLKELRAKNFVQDAAVKHIEDQLLVLEKEKLDLERTIKQAGDSEKLSKENLNFTKGSYNNALELLEWQTNRPYSDKDSSQDLKKAFLKAPIPGRVIRINPEFRVHAQVPSGFQAMVIAPTNEVLVRCKVHELDLMKLKTGERGTVIFDALPDKKFSCKIDRIPWTSRNPALEVPADYDIECLIDSHEGKIIDGLTCTVKVSVQQ